MSHWCGAVLARALPAPTALTVLCLFVAGLFDRLLPSACPACYRYSFVCMALQQVLRLLLWLLLLVWLRAVQATRGQSAPPSVAAARWPWRPAWLSRNKFS